MTAHMYVVQQATSPPSSRVFDSEHEAERHAADLRASASFQVVVFEMAVPS